MRCRCVMLICVQVESYFVESLEAWRKQQNIEKMTLVGHSLGGYLSVVYALKYSQHVEKLILVSPAGIPQKPDDYEFGGGKLTGSRRRLVNTFMKAWEWNITPQSVIRAAGPFGEGTSFCV
jgi:pimeloyl-ACP methyl ester carboxylesterase